MSAHIQIIEGVDFGMQHTVPPEGARLGRSSKNDIVIIDPLLSRHHCRLFFKSDGKLWVTDLGSANQTLVNGQAIQETALQVGDVITLGNTKIKVINNQLDDMPSQDKSQSSKPLDLGLGKPQSPPPHQMPPPPNIFFLLLLAAISTAAAIAVFYPKFHKKQTNQASPETIITPEETSGPLSVRYEKVIASTQNIFRFWLSLSTNGLLTVQMDDLANNRHLNKQKNIDSEYISRLAVSLKESGFFTLEREYKGIAQNDLYELHDVSISIGKQIHRSKVVNRIEPPVFQSVREIIESFCKNELGLWAIQYPTEKLKEMAEKAWLHGKKLYQERAVKLENLFEAIKNFKEADWHLETIEPKPDYYAEMLTLLSDSESELQDNYEQANFRAYQSIKNHEWDKAAVQLRSICEMIPDRSDQRHADARKKLLDVEKRQEPQR